MKTKIPAQILITFVLVSCVPSQTGTAESPTLFPAPPTQGEVTQMAPFPTMPSGMQDLIEKAKQDLAQRLSIPSHKISLVEAKEVVWSDGSAGCPQPGMMYAQVLTPGYLVRLNFDGRNYEYHTTKSGALTYCENPQPPVEGMPDNT